jgi:transposase
MTRAEREALSQRICNFFRDAANNSVKTTVNYFKKQNIPQRTIYNILKRYITYNTTKDRPRSGRPMKLSHKNLTTIVKSVNNRCGVSQRKIGRRFKVHQCTISRNLRKRTPMVIRKRRKAPKMNNQEQEKRARKNCGKLYRYLLNGCDLILDDEKYFKLTGDNVMGNRLFYSTDPNNAPVDVKFQKKRKFEPKIMIWMAISSKGISDVYVHKSKQAIRQKIYIDQCIKKRLLPFIKKFHHDGNYLFWPDLATAHYGTITQEILQHNHVPYVSRQDNPPNVPQARPIETVWTQLERKVFENNWEGKNLTALIRRIKQKAKELDQKMLQDMIEGVRRKLRVMWRDGLYSVL